MLPKNSFVRSLALTLSIASSSLAKVNKVHAETTQAESSILVQFNDAKTAKEKQELKKRVLSISVKKEMVSEAFDDLSWICSILEKIKKVAGEDLNTAQKVKVMKDFDAILRRVVDKKEGLELLLGKKGYEELRSTIYNTVKVFISGEKPALLGKKT